MCFRPKDVPSKKVVLVELERAKVGLEQENASLRAKLSDFQECSARACKERDVLKGQRQDLEAQLQQRSTYVSNLLTQVSTLRGNLTSQLHELLDQQLQAATGQVQGKPQTEGSSTVSIHVVQPECLEGAPRNADPVSDVDLKEPATTAPQGKIAPAHANGLDLDPLAAPTDSDGGRKLSAQEQLDRELAVLSKSHERALQQVSLLQLQLRQAEDDNAMLRADVTGVRKRLEQAEADASDKQQFLQLRCAALEQENEQLTGMSQEMQQRLEAALDKLSASKKQWTTDSCQLAKQAAELESANGRLREVEAEARSLHAQLATAETQAQGATAKAAELQEQLAKQAAELESANSRLRDVEAEARSLHAQLETAEAQAQDATVKVAELQEQLATRTTALETASSALAARDAELEVARAELTRLQGLAEDHQQLHEAASAELRDAQGAMMALKEELQVVGSQLEVTRRDLAATQQQLATRTQELSDAQAQLQRSCDAHTATSERLRQVLADLEGNETQLAEANKQYLATKQSVISTAKQLASMAKDHSAALDKLRSIEAEATTLREQLLASRGAEASARALSETNGSAAREAREAADKAEAEARRLRVAYDEASADLRRKIMLLTAIARMANKGQASQAASGGRFREGQEPDQTDAYGAVTSEQQLRLKICESPLPLLSALTAGIMDSSRLRHLSLDMDTSREVTWEKAGLRICCLAAAIGLNNSLQTLQLGGWTWGELGNGTALPFLALGGGGGLASGMLRCVQLATNLFDVEAAAMLKDLLAAGLVELAVGAAAAGGEAAEEGTQVAQGVLHLYSGNERLDGWYRDMLLLARQQPPLPPQPPHTPQHPQAPASTPAAPAAPMSGAHNGPADNATPAATTTSLECDLSSEALESHHMVLVMTVLLRCPRLLRLRLDGNKLGDGGAALLALGLSANAGLRELYLSRNGIRAAGARSLARSLEGANSTLLRLDLSGQRLEGLGAAGAEAMAQALRVNRTIEDLNLSSCGMAGTATACFVGAIRAAGATRPRPVSASSSSSSSCASSLANDAGNRPATAGGGGSLRRLVLSGNNMDAATAKTLQAAAAERPGLVLSL